MIERPVTEPAGPRHLPLILFALAMVLFTTSAQFLIVSPILPRIAEALTVPEENLGALITVYAIAVGGFAIVAGPISDRIGRRAILRWGTLWMGVALLLHGFASSYEALMGLRFLAGTASGILGGASVAYVGDVVPNARRGTALGIVTSGFAFGQVLGIPLGTLLAGVAGYQAPFVAFGVLMIAVSALCWLVLEPSPRREGRFGLAEALDSYRWIFAQPALIAVNVSSTTMMLSVSVFIVYQPLWLERTFDADERWIAALFAGAGLANAASGALAGAASDRLGRKSLVLIASGGLAACMIATPFMTSWAAICALFCVTMGLAGMRMAPLNAWVTGLVDAEHRGALMAVWLATGQIGFALGSAMAGWAWSAGGFLANAALGCAAALVTAVILAVGVPEPAR